jgi:hypothetical protein
MFTLDNFIFIMIPHSLLWGERACVFNLGVDQLNLVLLSCGGASHAPSACIGVRRRRLTLGHIYFLYNLCVLDR